jgi:hypothetical protein
MKRARSASARAGKEGIARARATSARTPDRHAGIPSPRRRILSDVERKRL